MKVVKIIGGLGNQMFQYAFYKRLIKEYPNEDIFVDTSLFKSYKLHNGLELENVFHLNLNIADNKNLRKVTRYTTNYKLSRIFRKFLPKKKTEYIEKKDFIYDDEVLHLGGNFLLEGYWQNAKYFDCLKNEIRKDFSFNNPLDSENKILKDKIQSCNSVSIHIRRGDYLKLDLYKDICDFNYYNEAVEIIKEKVVNPVFYIFSNDLDWCKMNMPNILGDSSFYFVHNTGKMSYIDMQLMSECKHNIIANSSFSWWAAWLNLNSSKIIIAPKKWLNKDDIGKPQLDSWILV